MGWRRSRLAVDCVRTSVRTSVRSRMHAVHDGTHGVVTTMWRDLVWRYVHMTDRLEHTTRCQEPTCACGRELRTRVCYRRTRVRNLRYGVLRTRTVLLEPVAQCSQNAMDRGPPRRVPATGPGRIAPVDGGGLGDTLHSERLAYVGTARVTHTSVCEPTGVHTSPLPAAPHRPNTC